MKKRKYISIYRFVFGIALLTLIFLAAFLGVKTNTLAFADSATVTVAEVTCLKFEFIDGAPKYVRNAYDYSTFGRFIDIVFELSGGTYYEFSVSVDGGEFLDLGKAEAESGRVKYEIRSAEGTVTVKCSLYADASGVTPVAENITTVKSDITSPAGCAVDVPVNWQGADSVFDVRIDWRAFDDVLSGRKTAYYAFTYDSADEEDIPFTEINLIEDEITAFQIGSKGTLKVYCVDNAGNYFYNTWRFANFDFIPPLIPAISAVPNVNLAQSGGLAKYYSVTVTYPTDAESGIDKKYISIINSGSANDDDTATEVREYDGRTEISRACTIRAWSVDFAGNVSEVAEITLVPTLFDTVAPKITHQELKVDITKTNSCTLTLYITDGQSQSGIKSVILKPLNISAVFWELSENGGYYTIEFDATKAAVISIYLEDNAANWAEVSMPVAYFNETEIKNLVTDYTAKYAAINFSEYNSAVADDIKNAYTQFSRLFTADNSRTVDFENIGKEIDELIGGKSNFKYSIESLANYASSNLSYSADTTKINGFLKGDTLHLIFSKGTADDTNYVNKSGLSGFTDFFKLNLFHNSTEIPLTGVTIEVDCPSGYYSRQFVLFDMATGEKIEVEKYNNKLSFKCVSGGSFALVISGSNKKDAANNTPVKSVKVFGRNIPLGTFLGVVLGAAGGVAVAVVILIIIKKKRT